MALPVAISTADCAVLSFSAGLAMSASPAHTKPCKEKFSEHQSGTPLQGEAASQLSASPTALCRRWDALYEQLGSGRHHPLPVPCGRKNNAVMAATTGWQ